jgi:hypothetical protein
MAITRDFAQNWFKTARLLHTDDSWRSTRCFLATWVTFKAQSDSGDVKQDLSLATSGTGSNRDFFRLVGHLFNHRMCILVPFN